MIRVFADLPDDEEGRKVIRMGGECPACGNGPAMKYASNGKVVLYHLPTECNQHMRSWKARFEAKKDRERNAA